MGKRLSLRVFRWTSVLLATVGLALLYAMAVHRDLPLVKVGEIRPTMNFAFVRIAGRVVDDTRIFRDDERINSLRFTVEDESGVIDVIAYRQQAAALVEAGLLPRHGDVVEVAGSLGIAAEEEAVLRLQSPAQVRLTREKPKRLELADLSMEHARGYVEVSGTIASIDAPEKGSKQPWNVYITDGTIRRPLVFWSDVYDALPDKDKLVRGATVRAVVHLATFMGRLQLSVMTPQDLHIYPREAKEPARPKVKIQPIAGITAAMTGQTATVEGRLDDPRPVHGGMLITVVDGSGSIDMVLWTNKFSTDYMTNLVAGAALTVSGRIRQYQDRLEIVPNRTNDVVVTARAP
jgi:DNA/RNA endonuclease YhcR with UshA esterase domain